MSSESQTISRSVLMRTIREAAHAVADGRPEGQKVLDSLMESGLANEVLRPSTMLHEQGEIAAAVALYRTFLASRGRADRAGGSPEAVPVVLRNMAIAMLQLGDIPAARRFHVQAVSAGFDDPSGPSAWGDYLAQHGYQEAAAQELAARLLTVPDSRQIRSLIFTLREFCDMDPGSHLQDHLGWWAGQPPLPPLSRPPRPREGRKLRLGVIVRDLRNPSSFNRTFDAFPHIHGEDFEVSLVSTRSGTELRGTLAGLPVHDLEAHDPESFARGLAALGFDMLLDLVSHGNSTVFAALRWRPAPIQLGWISSGISSGVPWIDYMLTDELISPVGSERFYSETLVRVPAPAFSVPVLREAPDLVEPPVFRNGHVTFGVFNRISKVTMASLEAWAEIMQRVPTAHMRFQNSNVTFPGVTARLKGFFAERGVAPERLQFSAYVPEAEYLRDIGQTDIALEPFPQTGGVTAFDALWMGVPSVIHVVDDRPCCRAALLPASAAGIGMTVSANIQDYVETAVMLANEPELLRELRFAMRDRLAKAAFTRPESRGASLRRALEEIWRQACAGRREPIWVL